MYSPDEQVKKAYIIGKELNDRLEELIKVTGQTKQFVVNRALEEYLEKAKKDIAF